MSVQMGQAEGFAMRYENYGKGDPGYHESITRLSDGAEMYSGPYVSLDVDRRHPDWVALSKAERARIRAALHAAVR